LFSIWAENDVKLTAMTLCRQRHKMSKRHDSDRVRLRHSAFACLCLITLAYVSNSAATVGSTEQRTEQLANSATLMHPASEVTFQTVSKGSRSGVREPRQVVLRNQAEWKILWGQHVSVDANPAPPPAIDFAKELVAAVFLGEKPTGGYDTAISRAQRSDDTVVIYYRERIPAPGAIVTQSLTQPFHIVRIHSDVNSMVIFRRES
jgi:hypothetical protein